MRIVYFVFLLISGILNACVFLGPSNKDLYSDACCRKPYDAIIIPGIPYDSAATEWDLTLKARIYWSKYLYEKGFAKNIIYSGSSVYTPYVESKIMAMYGEKLGIPNENIFAETNAEHSTENVYYSYYYAKQMGFEKIAVATDPFQARMLRSYPKRLKIDIDFIPFLLDTIKVMKMEENIKIDAEQAKVKNFTSIVDRESRFKRILGTMGKNVIRDENDIRDKPKR